MYGLKTWGSHRGDKVAARKPTVFMTNSRAIGKELSRRCSGDHKHQCLTDGRAKEAAKHPPELCRAVCRGFIQQKKGDAKGFYTFVDTGEVKDKEYAEAMASAE